MNNKTTLSKHANKRSAYIDILVVMGVGSLILLIYGFKNILQNNQIMFGYVLLFSAFAIIADGVYLGFTKNEVRSTVLTLVICMIFLGFLLFSGGTSSQALLWILIIPLIAFYTQEMKKGIIFSQIFSLYIIVIALLDSFSVIQAAYSLAEYAELWLVYSLICVMTYMYEAASQGKENQIYRQLYTDSLTQLPNRKKLMLELQKCQNNTLFLINVDDFKEINDLYGSTVGDRVLCEISQRLCALVDVTKKATVFKQHADEFAVLFQNTICTEDYKRETELFLNIFSENFQRESHNIAITASIGISDSTRDILADTDIALKTAKAKKLPFFIFDAATNVSEKYKKNHKELNRLKKALVQNDIVPFFQPIVSTIDGSIKKYECLVRLIDTNTIIPPSCFLELSKRAKLYSQITRRVVQQSFFASITRTEEFSINLCLDDLLNPETTSFIYEQLDQYNNGDRIVFELLESEKIEDSPEVLAFISHVKSKGCKIAIDDFGSGYSNFDYILRIQADYIKIDASLIRNIDTDANSRIITETIVNFAKRLGIQTIAEFVHSSDIHRIVTELGIDYSQGFFLGKPEQLLPKKIYEFAL